jgi:N-glycosylase/DNA lyase
LWAKFQVEGEKLLFFCFLVIEIFCLKIYPRWKKSLNGEWMGVLGGYVWLLTQDESCINYRVVKPCVIKNELPLIPATKKKELKECIDYEQILKDYFQLDIDLESLYRQWSLADANFNQVAKNYVGVRMLRQDPVENLFAFICSSNNNIQRFVLFFHHSISK